MERTSICIYRNGKVFPFARIRRRSYIFMNEEDLSGALRFSKKQPEKNMLKRRKLYRRSATIFSNLKVVPNLSGCCETVRCSGSEFSS